MASELNLASDVRHSITNMGMDGFVPVAPSDLLARRNGQRRRECRFPMN